jgi:hypothetical protein
VRRGRGQEEMPPSERRSRRTSRRTHGRVGGERGRWGGVSGPGPRLDRSRVAKVLSLLLLPPSLSLTLG